MQMLGKRMNQQALFFRTPLFNTDAFFHHANGIVAALCLLLVLTLFPGAARADFTLDDEKKLGKEFYEKLEKANLLLENERARDFLNRMGRLLLDHADKAPFDFKFSIIRSSAINAFATPGGYIYVNQGLITMAEDEGQLASVIAHEIAHVNGRHIAENIARSQKINIATLAGILAGAFLGGGTDASAAIASFSLAAGATLSLKYSREQEEAADRMGIAYLVRSGYGGNDMLQFMRIMRRYEYYSNTIPSYFLTHPGTDERIRYIDALLQTTYLGKGSRNIIGNLKRIQTILLLSGITSDALNLQQFQRLVNENPANVDALYGLAVTQNKLGMTSDALATFQKALAIAPGDIDILRDQGIAFFKLGRYSDAEISLNQALRSNGTDPDSVLYLGKTYEVQGNMNGAIEQYKKLTRNGSTEPEILYSLAMAYGKANQAGESHYYFGFYFKKKEKTESALFHFKAASKLFSPDSDRFRVIAKEIEALNRLHRAPAPATPRFNKSN